MARAKQTDRAEARRRYRASIAPQAVAIEDAEGAPVPNRLSDAVTPNRSISDPASSGRKSGRAADPLATEPLVRQPGILGALRGASRPLDVRGDIAILPDLALRSKAIWLPSLLVLVAGVLALVPGLLTSNAVAELYVSLFLYPPMAAPFLAGILAPRAGWLAGYLVSLLAGVLVAGAVLASPTSGTPLSTLVIDALVIMPVFGGFVGGFAGFYKRFLRLSSPNARGGRPANRPNRRTAAKATARR